MEQMLVAVIPRNPRVPEKVIDTLIMLFVEFSVLSVGSMVIPAIIDKGSWTGIIGGGIVSLLFAIGAISLSWRK